MTMLIRIKFYTRESGADFEVLQDTAGYRMVGSPLLSLSTLATEGRMIPSFIMAYQSASVVKKRHLEQQGAIHPD